MVQLGRFFTGTDCLGMLLLVVAGDLAKDSYLLRDLLGKEVPDVF